MKKFWLVALVLSLSVGAVAQEDGDFFEDEPMEPDYEYQPSMQDYDDGEGMPPSSAYEPPPGPAETPPPPPPPPPDRGSRFSRPFRPDNGSRFNRGGSVGSSGSGISGKSDAIEFRLVDPPEYWEKKKPMKIPPHIRPKVEDKLKEAERSSE